MSTARRLHYDYDEYLRALADSPLKLEYCEGTIYAIPSGTIAHAELSARMIVLLTRALPETCRIATSDLKVRVEATDLSTFPDVSVACEPRASSPRDANAVTNPTLLVEVTSKSTEDYDRGEKLSHYKQLDSLRAVLFVSHRSRRVTLVARADGGGWLEREARGGETLALPLHGATIAIDEVYRDIALDPV